MKKLFFMCLLFVLCTTSASAITTVIGAQVSSPPIVYVPTTLSIVCDGTLAAGNNCPQYWSPDWTDDNNLIAYGYTNQTTPGRCLKSVNGAVSWSYCSADPFTTSYLNTTPTAFAATSTGALLAAVNVNNTTQACVIKRSTDGGVTWTTVHTQNGTYACGAWSSSAMPSPMKCAKYADTCVLYGYDVATTSQVAVFTSINNGATWTSPTSLLGSPLNPPMVGSAMNDDGTLSITGATTGSVGRSFVYSRDGTTYVTSAAWGTAVGNSRCTGPFIYNNIDPAVMCGANSSTQTWQMVRMNSTVPTTIAQFTLGNGSPTSGQSPDVIGIQWATNIFYLITRLHATGATNVYVTVDNFSTMNFLGTLTPTTIFGSNPRGDIYIWGSAIYWSSGYYTPTGHIMKVS